MRLLKIVSFAAVMAAVGTLWAAPISYVGGSYSQDFNGLPTSGSTTVLGTGPHDIQGQLGGAGVTGWTMSNYLGSSADTEYRAQDGSLSGSAGRGVLSLGTGASTERALGELPTSNQISRFGVAFTNSTGSTLEEFTLGFTGEQWRRGDVIMGGSADLSPSTKTLIDDNQYFQKGHYDKRNIAWGVRELGMCGACNGLALHGGIRPFGATFFVFTDYARPALRLAALMKLPVIYVMTHESIGVGEDGPTHQPVEHMMSLRMMPNMMVIRPADANETAFAWRAAMNRTDGPTMLLLTRQNLAILDRTKFAPADGLLKGAYVLARESKSVPDVILIASGSEVELCLAAKAKLAETGCDARVVSMPCWEFFEAQPKEYRDQVLPPAVKARLAVEAGTPFGWEKWVGSAGDVIGINRFGASAPYKEIFKHLGFTVDNVVARAQALRK